MAPTRTPSSSASATHPYATLQVSGPYSKPAGTSSRIIDSLATDSPTSGNVTSSSLLYTTAGSPPLSSPSSLLLPSGASYGAYGTLPPGSSRPKDIPRAMPPSAIGPQLEPYGGTPQFPTRTPHQAFPSCPRPSGGLLVVSRFVEIPERTPKGRRTSGASTRPVQLHPVISFNEVRHDNVHVNVGVPFRDLFSLERSVLRTDRPRDPAFFVSDASEWYTNCFKSGKIKLQVKWPGYEHAPYEPFIQVLKGKNSSITRAELGHKIAMAYGRFVEGHIQHEQSKNPHWIFARGRYTIDHLVLLSLENISEHVWVAGIAAPPL